MQRSSVGPVVVLLFALSACSAGRTGLGGPADGAVDDIGGGDLGGRDLGTTDLGTTDLGTTDLGTTDLGTTDLGTTDLGTTDLGTTDLGETDLGTTDLGTTDLGTDFGTDLGPPDLGPPDLGPPDLGPPDLGTDAGPCGPCASPMLCCGTTCLDPRSDVAHCGSCAPCAAAGANQTASCMTSTCTYACNAGFGDCDGVAATGCEASFALATNCGSCGNVCGAGRACVTGMCARGWAPLSLVSAPSGRRDHSAVWTGTRMIVWGGDDMMNNSLDTGASYDPVTDTWTALPTAGAPTGRRGHVAVWTGTEMIVWGGYQAGTGWLQDGGAYNPATNAWRTLSTGGRPSARSRLPSVWSGTQLLVWGGWIGTGSGVVNDGKRYAPAGDMWTNMGTSGRPSSRRWQSAAWDGSAMIVWGGEDGGGNPLADGAVYAPASDNWSGVTATAAPSARARAAFVWAPSSTTSYFLVWGGDDGDFNGIFGTGVRASGGRYDPVMDRWGAMSASPLSARSRPAAVWTGAQMMVWGGRTANSGFGTANYANDGASYDPATDAWAAMSGTGAPLPRSDHTAVWTGTEMIVWGGDDGVTTFGDGGRYLP